MDASDPLKFIDSSVPSIAPMTHLRKSSGESRALLALAGLALLAGCAGAASSGMTPAADPASLATQVEIRRTTWGVPQILAQNLRAAGLALAWVQLEDHGPGLITGIHAGRGTMALVEGRGRIDADANARRRYARAVETFALLSEDTRDVYIGFAEGMNLWVRRHGEDLPDHIRPDFTGVDVLARDINWPGTGPANNFRRRLEAAPGDPRLLARVDGEWVRAGAPAIATVTDTDPAATGPIAASFAEDQVEDDQNVGSNAWALGPARTSSGNAILLRNPHLDWTAGYYEAHVRVPGKLDFYGDFRIGGPFVVIGGYNRDLGFSTTNNQQRGHEFYAFRVDPSNPDAILLDGRSVPLLTETVTVEYQENGVSGTETREFVSTTFGPVVHRADSLVYVFRPSLQGDYRMGEQWMRMMRATSLDEWKDAMRMGARSTSHFTYADRAGNIFYVSVQAAPDAPHPLGGDTLAIFATRTEDVWANTVPFDDLPQLLNPEGGYLHNENDSPHYTNLNEVLDHDFRFWVEPPALRLRSQHALELLHNERAFSLEDVIATKHSMRMLLADRVKADLVGAVLHANPDPEVRGAIEFLNAWDNTAAAESRGAVLFETWWNRYRSSLSGAEPHAVPWTPDAPTTTPRGLSNPTAAAEAFNWAVAATAEAHGSWAVAWGDVHRVRRADVDVPVGGCGGALGCFRVLNFDEAEDGKLLADGGDGWILAVEFGDEPRGYTVLAYGQSPDPANPYHANQAALFASGRMKPVFWSEAEIEAAVIDRYHPGE